MNTSTARGIKGGEQYGMLLMRSSNALLEQLKQKLPKEDFALVEQLLEQDLTAHSIECECHFKYGFSAGLILLQEASQEIKFRLCK